MVNIIIFILILVLILLLMSSLNKFYIKYTITSLFNSIWRSKKIIILIVLLCVITFMYQGFSHHVASLLQEQAAYSNAGHIKLYKQGYLEQENNRYADHKIENSDEIITLLKNDTELMEQIDEIAMQLNFSGLLINPKNNLSVYFSGLGISPEAAIKFGSFDVTLLGSELSNIKNKAITVDESLAHLIKLDYDNLVNLFFIDDENHNNVFSTHVRGVFKSEIKSEYYSLIKIPLQTAMRLTRSRGVSSIAILLKNNYHIEDVIKKINLLNEENKLNLHVVSWIDSHANIKSTITFFYFSLSFLNLLIVIFSFFLIYSLIIKSVYLAMDDIVELNRLGIWKFSYLRIFILEGILLSIVISIISLLLGILFSWGINIREISLPLANGERYSLFIRWDWQYYFILKIPFLLVLSSLIATIFATFNVNSIIKENFNQV